MNCKFAIPYNGDEKLIDEVISDYLPFVESFYGSFGLDKFGGGRAQKENFIKSKEELKQIIKKLERNNIEFNYVINNTSLMNKEFQPDFIKEFKSFISLLISLGVKIVTLCNPYLISLTKEFFPEIKISASVNFKIRSLDELQYTAQLGCDEVTLHYDILKNFSVLKQIRKNSNMLLKLIPNDIYIKECPWQKGHTRMQGAHSRNKSFKTPYFSYFRNKCVNIRNYRPEEVLKAMWIPPINIDKYTKIGYTHFKLLDRLATTKWILRVLKSYIDKTDTYRLEEIMGTYGVTSNIKKEIDSLSKNDPPYPKEKLEVIPHINFTKEKNINIINFWSSDSHPLDCGNCSMCYEMVNGVLEYPENMRETARRNNQEWQESITKLKFIEKLNNSYIQRIEYKN
ncbi:U32 family peptidase [Salipaludibacillus sp. LMS25]|jgi:collagenase-like PrtC family protease|uniref:U32 family peptidase n=1 Tax=Salipaludibacillus sp. LMS25 TaxID=2924031 RepID=UPI0020D1DCCD|nr:U32 family peptidase [Salipaludibacillus sp. LMS25]UTR16384.1 U32 family peptidase [Salipaludibacillus sp. LMS25]